MVSLNPELTKVWQRICDQYLGQQVENLPSRYEVTEEDQGCARRRIWQVGKEVTFRPPINPASAFGLEDQILAPRQGRLIGLFRITDSRNEDHAEQILGVIAGRTLSGTPRQFDVPLGDIEPSETIDPPNVSAESQPS